ncbi:MFS transporter [Nocardioides cavernae]|uniref:MFS transporter n=1 Tax=Nocardioides cavernae TaxID=1921566 RepID=A0ABR8N9G1_9ACTN|nr:MFS transporter [Nocardioides cavernae]MBD3924232.1 MFS transporter [Nocardioides cavernae]MBM7510829.1 MFS family permease [Nocardioides cavernae]
MTAFRWLFVVTALLQSTFAATKVLIIYRAIELGGSASEIGVLVALYAVVPLVAALPLGRAVDRGHVSIVMRSGGVLTIAGVVLVAAGPNLIALGAANILIGCGQMCSMVSAQGLIPRLSTDDELDRRFGAWSVATSLGQTLGVPLAGLVVHVAPSRDIGVGWALLGFAVASVAASAATLVPALRFEPFARNIAGRDPQPTSQMLTTPGMRSAMLASVIVLVSIDLLMAYLPLLGVERGFGVLAVTLILTARSGSALIARVLMTPIRARFSREQVMVTSTLISAPTVLALAIVGNPWIVGACMVVAGFAWGLAQPLSMTWVASLVTPANRASALSLRITGNRVGQVAVPLAAGGLSSAAGVSSVFVVIGTALFVSALNTRRSLRGGPAAPAP